MTELHSKMVLSNRKRKALAVIFLVAAVSRRIRRREVPRARRHQTLSSSENFTGTRPLNLYSDQKTSRISARRNTPNVAIQVHYQLKPVRTLFCPLCSFTTSSKGLLYRHLLIHTGAKPYSCTKCDCRFVLPEKLLWHMKLHQHQEPFKCRGCKEEFVTSMKLIRHQVLTQAETRWQCEYCGEGFSDWQELKIHDYTRKLRDGTIYDNIKCSSNKKLFAFFLKRENYQHL